MMESQACDERKEGHWPGVGRSSVEAWVSVAEQEGWKLQGRARDKSQVMSGRDQ